MTSRGYDGASVPVGNPLEPAPPGTAELQYAAKVRAWVERTCAEQGIPVKITDPVTVRRVATLLDGKARP